MIPDLPKFWAPLIIGWLSILPYSGCSDSTSPVKLTNTDQIVQIGDREPYEAKLTCLSFERPICVLALEIHTLQPLTGAEDIEITHSLCEDSNSPNLTWTLAHYTNKKNVFVLRHPVLARRLGIIAGFGRGSSSSGLTVLNIDIKKCDPRQIFGDPKIEEEQQIKKHCKHHTAISKDHKHRRKHHHVMKVPDLDQLHVDEPTLFNSVSTVDKDPDSVEAVFVRQKRQTSERYPDSGSSLSTSFGKSRNFGECPSGYSGEDCSVPDCSLLSNCSGSGVCVHPNTCRCHQNYFGSDCSRCSGWFCNQCDFYCVHGQCDTVTRSCVCRPDWTGAACDVCKTETCPSDPRVKLILPQTGPWSSEDLFIFVYGSDLPKSRDTRYRCFFGSISTSGNWISNELVRCAIPHKGRPGKHVFNLMPSDSEVYVQNENGKTVHFTFYVPCEKSKCHGSCLGPVCLCDRGFSGENCLQPESPIPKKSETLFNSSITEVPEGEFYSILIPVDPTAKITKVESTVDGLVLDPFKHLLTWEWPRGSAKPYDIKVTVMDVDMNLDISWQLQVPPSYSPITGKIQASGIDNGFLLKGFIQQNTVNGSKPHHRVPVLLEVLSSQNPGQILESIEIESDSESSFSHVFYPYIGESVSNETFTVRAKHPGTDEILTSCATWKFKKLPNPVVLDFPPEIVNGSSNVEFKTKFNNSFCSNFRITVIHPSDTVTVGSWTLDGDSILKVEFIFSENLEKSGTVSSILGFHCDEFNGISFPLDFVYSNANPNRIKVTPSVLNFYSNQNRPMFEIVEIDVSHLENTVTEAVINSNSLLPFYVASSNPPYLENTSLFQNGTRIKMMLGLDPNFETTKNSKTGYLTFGNPETPLFTIPYSITPISTSNLELSIIVEGLVNLNTTSAIDYPLEVVITGINGHIQIKRMIYINVKAEFYPLDSGVYKISITSPAFESHEEFFKLTPDNTTLSIFLNKKKQIIPIFDGSSVFISEFPIAVDPTIESTAEFQMEPSVFLASEINKEIFANIIFKKGPIGATAVLKLENQDKNSEFFIESVEKISETFCIGCGLRPKIKITRNLLYIPSEDSKCNIAILKIPFIYSIKGFNKDFDSFFSIVVDKRSSKTLEPEICEKSENPIPESTTLFKDCAAAKLIQCRNLYQPMQSCGGFWRNIPDDTLSIHVYAMFMKLVYNCKINQVDMRKLQSLIQCISSLDVDCPIVKPSNSSESSAFNALFSQISAISPITKSLHGFFPALSALEAQLIDFPTHMANFLNLKLIQSADILKSLGRQFGANDPFSMLHDILTTMFSKIDHVVNATDEIAKIVGFVEKPKIFENQEFQVTVIITNVMTNQVMKNLKFQLEMLDLVPSANQNNINYRIGPLYYSGGIPDYLTSGSTLTVTWKVLPISERRLTNVLEQIPNVILTYETDGRRKVQRIRIPKIQIHPERHLRIFALAYPSVLPRIVDSQGFNLGIHMMNSGFSDLKKIKIVEFGPWIVVDKTDSEFSKNSLFKIQAVNLNEKFIGYTPDITVGELKSGKTGFIGINLTTLHNDILVDDDIPEYLDFRFFFIRDTVSKNKYVVSEGDPTDYKSSLFHFDLKTSKIEDLTKIQLLEKIERDESTPNSYYHKVTATFQRLMDESELLNAARPENLLKNTSTVYGSLGLPENLDKNRKLVRISEISKAGLRRHLVDLKNAWITQRSQQRILNFIDTQALPPAFGPQVTYEFIYGDPKDFNAPYFSHRDYEIEIVPEMVVQNNTVLGKIEAQSPVGESVNYSLVTKEDIRNFAINGKTGEVILLTDFLPELPSTENGICTNVIVTDESKRQSIVPLFIRLPTQNITTTVNCTVFPEGISINHHVFTGDRSTLKMMEFEKFLPNFIPSTTSKTTENINYEISTKTPTTLPSTLPTTLPSSHPSTSQPIRPLTVPSIRPSNHPSVIPSIHPSTHPSTLPSTSSKVTEPWDEDDILVNLMTKPTMSIAENLFPTPLPFPAVETPSGNDDNHIQITGNPYQTIESSTASMSPSASIQAVSSSSRPCSTSSPTKPSSTTLLTNPDPTPMSTVSSTSIDTVPEKEYTVNGQGYTIEVIRFTGDFRKTTIVPVTFPDMFPEPTPTGEILEVDTETDETVPVTETTSDHMPESISSIDRTTPTLSVNSPFGQPLATVPTVNEDILVNLITIVTPPPTSALPVATRMSIYKTNNPRPGTINIGQIHGSGTGFMTYSGQQSIVGEQTSASMVDTACRLRDTKPIWSVVCDMAKTVHFKPM